MLSTSFLPHPSVPYMLLLFRSFAGKCAFIQAHSFFCCYWLFWEGEEWEWTMLTDKFKCKGQSKEDKVIIKSSAWVFYSVTSDKKMTQNLVRKITWDY